MSGLVFWVSGPTNIEGGAGFWLVELETHFLFGQQISVRWGCGGSGGDQTRPDLGTNGGG